MHHKRKRPKHRRAGCLFCKPHKSNKSKKSKWAQLPQELKARLADKEQRNEV